MTRSSDWPGFVLAIGKMFLSCGGREATDLTYDAYWEDLCHLTLAQVVAAIPEAKALAGRGYLPGAEDIRRSAEKQPAAPYHARLVLPEVKVEPLTPEQEIEVKEFISGLRRSVDVVETLENRQWPGFAKKGAP